MKQLYLLITMLVLGLSSLQSQSIIHIENGANLFIQPLSSVYLDGLQITPSNTLLLNNVSLERRTTVQQPVVNSHIQRIYHFSNTVPSFSGTIRFNYADNELNQLPEAMLTLNINNGVAWQDFKTNVIRDGQNNFVETTLNTPVNMQELTLASMLAALPLQWGQVKGICNNNIMTVQWETLQEINTQHFIVERSSNGTSWQGIQLIAAAGQSASSIQYSISDSAITNASVLYYRIKSVDLDGSYSYSKVITIKPCSFTVNSMKLFPVPAITTLQLSFNSGNKQKASLRIFNPQGQQVKTQDLVIQEGNNLFTVDVRGLPAGTYYMQLMLDNQRPMTTSFIKQ